jgi:hypothetical protein
MSMLNGPPHLIQTKKNQSLQVDLDLLPSPSSSSPSSFTGVGTGRRSQSEGQVADGSGSKSVFPVYVGLLSAGNVMGVGFAGRVGHDQTGVLEVLVNPDPEVVFHVSGGPFVISGQGGSESVLVRITPPSSVTVVTYGGSSRLYDGWKKPVIEPSDMLTFQKSTEVTVSGGGFTVMVLTIPGSTWSEVV